MAGSDTKAHHLAHRRYAHVRIPRHADNEYRNRDEYGHTRHNNTWHCNTRSRNSYTRTNIYTCHYPHSCSQYLRVPGRTCPPVLHSNPLTTEPARPISYVEDDRYLWETGHMDCKCRCLVDTAFKLVRH